MLRALIIVASLSMPLIAPSAAAGADFETLHRAASEPSGWQSIGPAPPTISATVAADPKSHTIYIGSVGGGVPGDRLAAKPLRQRPRAHPR